jgi:uncharacterized protein YjiS (DUF1127 family)
MTFGPAVADLRHFSTWQPRRRRLLDLLIRFEAWLDARASRRTLHSLDDRALADVGLSRSDLERADRAASWQSLLLPAVRR